MSSFYHESFLLIFSQFIANANWISYEDIQNQIVDMIDPHFITWFQVDKLLPWYDIAINDTSSFIFKFNNIPSKIISYVEIKTPLE